MTDLKEHILSTLRKNGPLDSFQLAMNVDYLLTGESSFDEDFTHPLSALVKGNYVEEYYEKKTQSVVYRLARN